MSTKDQFRAFLLAEFSGEGAPRQSLIAQIANVQYKQLNAFLNGHQTLGEDARERVAEAFNKKYSECLEIGRLLLNGPQEEAPQLESSRTEQEQAIDRAYSFFFTALQHFAAKGGRGFQTALAQQIGKSLGFVNQILKNNKRAGFETQVKIATVLKFEYEDLLRFGRDLIEGRSIQD